MEDQILKKKKIKAWWGFVNGTIDISYSLHMKCLRNIWAKEQNYKEEKRMNVNG